MGDINNRIGQNLREVRKLRGLSGEALAELMQQHGVNISQDTIRRYERGERFVTAEEVIVFADVLNCSTQALVDGADPSMGTVPHTKKKFGRLLPEDHKILRNLAGNWDGDIHALIIADGIYAAIPPERRRAIIMELCVQADEAVRSGEMTIDDLPEGIAYMQQQLGGLYK